MSVIKIILVFSLALLSLLESQSFAETNYRGIPPRLCYRHLAEHPTTREGYTEPKLYINIIPALTNFFNQPECVECPSCHKMFLDLGSLWDNYICPSCKDIIIIKQGMFCTGSWVNSGYFQSLTPLIVT
jgi:hypothetical protein